MNPEKFKRELFDKLVDELEWSGYDDLGSEVSRIAGELILDSGQDLEEHDMETWMRDNDFIVESALCVNSVGLDFLEEGRRYAYDRLEGDFIYIEVDGETHEVFVDRFDFGV